MLGVTEDPEVWAQCFLALGQLMEDVPDFPAAIGFYRQGLQLEPADRRTWYLLNNNLGFCFNEVGKHPEAEGYCRQAIGIDPNRHNAYKNLGISLAGQGQYGEAIRCLIQATQVNPRNSRALHHLDEILESHPEIATEMRELAQQVEACRKAVWQALHPDSDDVLHNKG